MRVGKLNWPRREFWKAVVQTQPVIPFLPHGVVADLADGGSASNGDCFVYSRSGTGRNGRRRRMVALAASAAPSLDSLARVATRRRGRAVLPAPASAHPARVAAWTDRQSGHLARQGAALPGCHANGAQKCRRQQRSRSQWSVSATMIHCRLRRPAPALRHQCDRRRHCKRQPDHRPCGRGHATRCQHLHRLHGWNRRHHSWRRNDKSCVQRSNRQDGTAIASYSTSVVHTPRQLFTGRASSRRKER